MSKKCVYLFIFTAVIMMSSLTWYSHSEKKAEDMLKKPITFTFFQATPGKDVPQSNRVLKRIEEKTGVTIKFEYLAGEAKQKIGVMIASGDFPDFIDAGDGTAQMISANALLPIENDIPKYPNLQKYLGDEWNKVKNPKDGHIYVIPQFGNVKNKDGSTSHRGEAFWIQKAVLKEFNYPKVRTLDEYFDLIKRYKEKYPTIDGEPTIGFEILCYDWRSFCLINPPLFLAGYPNDGIGIVDEKTKTITNFADKEIYKRYYKKLNEVYHQGLIDKEAFVENYDQYIAKLSSGRVLGMVDQAWQFINASSSLNEMNKVERSYVPLPITYDINIPDRYADRTAINGSSGFAITKYCKDKDRALEFLNELLNDDMQRLVQWGEKDIDYKLDAAGKIYRTDKQREQQKSMDYVVQNLGLPLIWFPHYEGFFDDGNAYNINEQPEEFRASLTDYDKELLDAYGYNTFADFLSPAPKNPIYYPMWNMVFPTNQPETIAKAQIEELQQKYDVKMIIAKPEDVEAIWQEYLNELKKVDIAAYEKAMNEELQRRYSEWGGF